MFCTQCGSPMTDTAAFCSSCGAPAASAEAPQEQDVSIEPPVKDDEQESPPKYGTIKLPPLVGALAKPTQHNLRESPKPGPKKGKKKLIIAIAAFVVLLGVFIAIVAIFFPRDALIFLRGEERYTRDMFTGAARGVSSHLLNQFSERFGDDFDMDIGELTNSLSIEAEPGAVRRLANDFAFFDDNTIDILELLAASSLSFSTSYDISGHSPLMNLNSSWAVTGADSSTEELLTFEALFLNDAMYLRIEQLLDRYVGISYDDFGLDLFGLLGFFNMLVIHDGVAAFNEMERLSDFIDDNEQEINAMISDIAGLFFSSFDDMRVDRDVPVSIGDEMRIANIHRAVITIDEETFLRSIADVLTRIRDNEEYTSLIFDAMWIIYPDFNYTRAEFISGIDASIQTLEIDADLSIHRDEYFELYMYINRRNNIVGAGISPQDEIDGGLSFVLINDLGYNLTIDTYNTYLRVHGFLNSDRRSTTGDMYIRTGTYALVQNDGSWQQELVVNEGRLLDFEFGSDHLGIAIHGGDIIELIDDGSYMDAQTVALFNSLAFSMLLTRSDDVYTAELILTHLQPEISLTFSSMYRQLDYVSIAAPPSADVLYLDLPALMAGDMFALLPHLSALTEIYSNIFDIVETLDHMGFNVRRLLEGFLDDLFGGLF